MAGAGLAFAAFAAVSVSAAVEAADAQLKLQNTFKNNEMLSDSSVEAFNRQADALRDLTGVDDEAITSSQALLGQFKLTGQEVQKLTPLILDLSSKMDIDLQAAAKAVGKATQGSAGILSRYGIILDETALEADAFNAVMEGLQGTVGGFAKERGINEPWRILGAQLEEVAEQFGEILLPIIRQAVNVLRDLLPILKAVTDNLHLVVAALAGFAAFKYLPGLLLNIAVALEAVGAASIASGLLSVGAAISSIGASLAAAAPAATAFGTALIGGTAALAAWDPLGLVDDQEALNKRFEDGTMHLGKFTSQTVLGKGPLDALGQAAQETGRPLSHMQATAGLAEQGILNLGGATEKTARALEQAGSSGRIFSKELRESLIGELPAIVGTVVKYKDAFSLSPNEMKKIAATWAEIGRTMARDLKDILQSDLTPTMKAGIAALPPEMRHAWVEGNARQRNAIEASLLDTYKLEGIITGLVNDARRGGSAVGTALAEGTRAGIQSRAESVAGEAKNLVLHAIAAARAAAGARSPSKEMMKLGRDLMDGLRLGLVEGMPIAEQMEAIIHSMIDNMRNALPAWRKAIADFEDQLSRLTGRMGELRDAISGGFGGFLDISGGFVEGETAGNFIQEQLAAAKQFASVLRALESRNVSPALVGQIAEAGPEAIPFAQQLLQMAPSELRATNKAYQDIADIAQKTARTLSEAYFGDRIKDVRGDLHQLRDVMRNVEFRLEKLREIEVEQKGGDIILQIDGKTFAQITREQLNRDAGRNGGRTLTRTT